MPIRPRDAIRHIDQDEFHRLDYSVMAVAFDIHNQLGRFLDETTYKNELAFRLRDQGLCVDREFPLECTFKRFSTKRFIDVLIERAAVYEVKTAACFSSAHRNQSLNYLFLSNTLHGKLINFRPASVQAEFVSTTLTLEDRKCLQLDSTLWEDDEHSGPLRRYITELIADWGAFLDVQLYREAIQQQLDCGRLSETVVPLIWNGRRIGQQAVNLLTPDSMWTITATKSPLTMRTHYERFLTLTNLDRLHWINLNRSLVQFVTLHRR